MSEPVTKYGTAHENNAIHMKSWLFSLAILYDRIWGKHQVTDY
jgi:hypothetical protein